MTQPTLEDARKLSEWRPALGVLSVYLGFDPADRGGAWRTELRNGLDAVLSSHEDAVHSRRLALRATAKRLTERFEDGELRPPPRGEVGFVQVAEKAGTEHWFGVGVAPEASACVQFGSEPVVAPLLALCAHNGARGVALLSAERVRLLRCAEGALEDLADWELSITSLDWRERKSHSAGDPARAQGVGTSGHDQHHERLEHNRQRFLAECGGLAASRIEGEGLEELIVFGPARDLESFKSGFGAAGASLVIGGGTELISTPKDHLSELVVAAISRHDAERDSAVVSGALGEAKGSSRGALGLQETQAALAEGRVDHLVFDAAIDGESEALVRAALASGAQVTVVRDEAAAPLSAADGVAAVLRY